MSTHHAVWFSNPATGQRTAALILRSDKHDLKDIAKVSHLFPYSESLKMVKYHVSPGFPDFTGAFNWVQDNLNV